MAILAYVVIGLLVCGSIFTVFQILFFVIPRDFRLMQVVKAERPERWQEVATTLYDALPGPQTFQALAKTGRHVAYLFNDLDMDSAGISKEKKLVKKAIMRAGLGLILMVIAFLCAIPLIVHSG